MFYRYCWALFGLGLDLEDKPKPGSIFKNSHSPPLVKDTVNRTKMDFCVSSLRASTCLSGFSCISYSELFISSLKDSIISI